MKLPLNSGLRLLLVSNSLILLAPALLAPIYAIYVEQIGGDLLDAGLTAAIFAFSAGTICLFSGRISDHIKRHRIVVIVGSIIMAIGFLGYLWVDTIQHLFLVQIVIGIGEAIYYPPFDALYSSHLNVNKKATGWAAWEAMDYYITAFGAFFGALIVEKYGFDIVFMMMSILCVLSGLFIWQLRRKSGT